MRIYAAGLSAVLGVSLVLYPMLKVEEPPGIVALGVAGLAFLALSLTWHRARQLSVVALILIALHYALALHSAQVSLDVYAVLVAIGLFVLFEVTDLAIGAADHAPVTRAAVVYRTTTTLSISAAGALLAVLGILARSLFTGGAAGLAIGSLCALGLISVPLLLARRTPSN